MRTASIALLLSLSLTTACSSSDSEDAAGAGLADETPAAAASTPSAPAAPPPPAASAAPAEPAPAAPEPANEDAGAPAPPPPSDAGSPAVLDGSVIVVVGTLFVGRIVATLPGSWCNFYLDGAFKGGMSTLDVTVPIGEHEVRCDAGNGRSATALVTVSVNETESITMELPPAPQPSGPGTLVAVAVGGICAFSVNGAAKGTSSQLKLSVPPGTYSVSCKPATGAQKTRSVIIKPGETAMAMFKLQ